MKEVVKSLKWEYVLVMKINILFSNCRAVKQNTIMDCLISEVIYSLVERLDCVEQNRNNRVHTEKPKRRKIPTIKLIGYCNYWKETWYTRIRGDDTSNHQGKQLWISEKEAISHSLIYYWLASIETLTITYRLLCNTFSIPWCLKLLN